MQEQRIADRIPRLGFEPNGMQLSFDALQASIHACENGCQNYKDCDLRLLP
jgi:hypothetical protein